MVAERTLSPPWSHAPRCSCAFNGPRGTGLCGRWREPIDDDDPGFSGDPNEAQKIGSAGELEEIGQVRQELTAQGYDLVYSRHDIVRMKRNITAGRANRPPFTDEWLTEVFPDGRARPEIVAIDRTASGSSCST